MLNQSTHGKKLENKTLDRPNKRKNVYTCKNTISSITKTHVPHLNSMYFKREQSRRTELFFIFVERTVVGTYLPVRNRRHMSLPRHRQSVTTTGNTSSLAQNNCIYRSKVDERNDLFMTEEVRGRLGASCSLIRILIRQLP